MTPRACSRLLTIAALLVLAGPAWSFPKKPVDPNAVLPARFEPIPTSVKAGELLELEWDGVPAGAEELELILSLDDGATYTYRVTPQLHGRARSYRWTVPNFAAERARIRLRYGTEHGERDGALSPAFCMLADARAPITRDAVREDRGWQPAEARVPVSSFAPVGEASLRALREELQAEPTSAGSEFHRPATAAHRMISTGPLPFRPASTRMGAVAPTFVPMRN